MGCPCLESWSKSDLNLNSNSNLKLNRKKKRKRKKEETGHMGQLRALRAQLILHGPANRAHPAARRKTEEKKGCGHADQAHAASPLLGPALRPASLSLNLRHWRDTEETEGASPNP